MEKWTDSFFFSMFFCFCTWDDWNVTWFLRCTTSMNGCLKSVWFRSRCEKKAIQQQLQSWHSKFLYVMWGSLGKSYFQEKQWLQTKSHYTSCIGPRNDMSWSAYHVIETLYRNFSGSVVFSLRELCSQGECRTDKLSNFARCLREFASSLTEAAIAKAKKEEENSGKFPCMGLGGLCGTAAAFFLSCVQ